MLINKHVVVCTLNKLQLNIIKVIGGKSLVFYGCSLVVIRIDKKGELCNSKPCIECTKIIHELKLKKIYYSVSGGIQIENANRFKTTHISAAQRNLK